MALQRTQLWLPSMPHFAPAAHTFTSSVIDATGEIFAWIGQVWNKDGTTKEITKVGFLPGTVVSDGGSGLRLSLQNVNAAATLIQPDETQDQTVDFLASALTTNTWYQTGSLSANRSVAFGEMLAVVIEYDASGRVGSDAVNLNNVPFSSTSAFTVYPSCALKTGGTWAAVMHMPNIILEFSDGTFGTLLGGYPLNAVGTSNHNTGTTPDEVALQFTVPFACNVAGAWAHYITFATTRDHDLILYDGTTPIASVSMDGDVVAGGRFAQAIFDDEVTLTPGTTYYLAIKPTTVNNVTVAWSTVAAAGHLQARQGGASFQWAERSDAGAWSATTTKQLLVGLLITALDDGVGGGVVRPRKHGFAGYGVT